MMMSIDIDFLTPDQKKRLRYTPGVKAVVDCTGTALGVARSKRGAAMVLIDLTECDFNEVLENVEELPDRFIV